MHPGSLPPAGRSSSIGCRLRAAMYFGLGLLVSGCVSMRSVPLPTPGQDAAAMAVKIGDHVQVQTRTGDSIEFKVTAIESDALVGKDRRVRFDDMSGLQVRHLDKLRTGGAVGGTALDVLVVVAIVVIASGGFAIMPPG